MADRPVPREGILLTHFVVAADVQRSADTQQVYDEWSSRGGQFITPPVRHEHEIRCYLRDSDGQLIEVGQTIM